MIKVGGLFGYRKFSLTNIMKMLFNKQKNNMSGINLGSFRIPKAKRNEN